MNLGYQALTFAGQLFFWAGVLMFCIGVCILVSPALVMRAGSTMNRWIATDALFRRLDSATPTERPFYRHHRAFGLFLAAGAVYVIYQLIWQVNYTSLFGHTYILGSQVVAEWLARSLGFIFVAFGALAFVVGVVVFFRPSLLKELEEKVNAWFATESSLRVLDQEVSAPDSLFARSPRLVGMLVVLGSLYVIYGLRGFV